MEEHGWFGCDVVRPPEATREQLLAVHPASHIDYIDELCAGGGGHIDMDTVAMAATYEAAVRSAGGAVALVDSLLSGEAATGLLGHAAARAPRRAAAGDGVLLLRQRGGGGAPRRGGARRRAGADPRLGRPPRQRDERDLPRGPARAVRLDPRVAAVSGHGSGVRSGRGRRRGLHGQPAGAGRLGRRDLPLAGRPRRAAADGGVGAGARAGVGGLRRALAGPARHLPRDRARLRRDDGVAAAGVRGGRRAARADPRGRLLARGADRVGGGADAGADGRRQHRRRPTPWRCIRSPRRPRSGWRRGGRASAPLSAGRRGGRRRRRPCPRPRSARPSGSRTGRRRRPSSPCAARSSRRSAGRRRPAPAARAFFSASAREPVDAITTVHAALARRATPRGRRRSRSARGWCSARSRRARAARPSASGAGVAPASGVAPGAGAVVGAGVAAPSSGAADGVAVAPGLGAFATGCGSPPSSTSDSTSAATNSASTVPTSTIGSRQRGVGAIRVPTALPQLRHHSWSGASSAPQRGQARCSTAGGGVATSVMPAGPGSWRARRPRSALRSRCGRCRSQACRSRRSRTVGWSAAGLSVCGFIRRRGRLLSLSLSLSLVRFGSVRFGLSRGLLRRRLVRRRLLCRRAPLGFRRGRFAARFAPQLAQNVASLPCSSPQRAQVPPTPGSRRTVSPRGVPRTASSSCSSASSATRR